MRPGRSALRDTSIVNDIVSQDIENKGSVKGPRRAGRAKHWVVLSLAVMIAAFLAASAVLFVFPATDQPRHVDAILSLNGTDEVARESLAIKLAEEGYARVLLFSQGNGPTPCPKVPHVKVVCFIAVPGRTVGEAEFAANYAKHHRWDSIMVVPSRAQATRARLLLKRCFSGEVVVVPASFQLPHFPFEVIYEWAGLAKALLVDRQC